VEVVVVVAIIVAAIIVVAIIVVAIIVVVVVVGECLESLPPPRQVYLSTLLHRLAQVFPIQDVSHPLYQRINLLYHVVTTQLHVGELHMEDQ
jgi:hypothetical protein